MQQQQYGTKRRPKPKLTVSRQYTSSFSGIDWGFRSSQQDSSAAADDLLRDSSRQEFAKDQQDALTLTSSLGEAGEKRTVSRQYTSSFSGIDWGFRSSRPDISSADDDDLLHDSSRQEFTKDQQDALISSLGEAEELRNTIISQESDGVASASTTETAQRIKRGGHSTQIRPTLLTALNSWSGSLREMFIAPLGEELQTTNLQQGNGDEICPHRMMAAASATLVTRACSSQADESDEDDYGFLHWNDTHRSRK